MKVTFYTKISGRSPVWDYVKTLPTIERVKVVELSIQIERNGLDIDGAEFKHIEGKLWEIKVSQSRIFYVLIGKEEMIWLHAYKKQSQKLPKKEKKIALKRLKEFVT